MKFCLHVSVAFFIACVTFQSAYSARDSVDRLNYLYAIITPDESVFTENQYWSKPPEISFLYKTHEGLESASSFLNKGESTKLFISSPTIVWCQQINVPLLIFPGDSLIAQMNTNGDIVFSSKINMRSGELRAFSVLAETFKTRVFEIEVSIRDTTMQNLKPMIFDQKIEDAITNLETEIKSQLKMLETKSALTKDFIALSTQYFQSAITQLRLEYYEENRKVLDKERLLENKMNNIVQFFNNAQLRSDIWGEYDNLRKTTKLLNKRKGLADINNRDDLNQHLEMVISKFKGAARIFLIADYLNYSIRYSIINLKDYSDFCKNQLTDTAYFNILKDNQKKYETYTTILEEKAGQYILASESNSPISIDALFEKNKGKLILIDFWASWCIPCRLELPKLRELKIKYKNKPIAFISISLDKNINNWESAGESEALSKENSFLLGNGEHSDYSFRGYKVPSIPRYMLFNKNGSVIDSNAPLPSNPFLQKLIEKNL